MIKELLCTEMASQIVAERKGVITWFTA